MRRRSVPLTLAVCLLTVAQALPVTYFGLRAVGETTGNVGLGAQVT